MGTKNKNIWHGIVRKIADSNANIHPDFGKDSIKTNFGLGKGSSKTTDKYNKTGSTQKKLDENSQRPGPQKYKKTVTKTSKTMDSNQSKPISKPGKGF
jgi:hypothetical protein